MLRKEYSTITSSSVAFRMFGSGRSRKCYYKLNGHLRFLALPFWLALLPKSFFFEINTSQIISVCRVRCDVNNLSCHGWWPSWRFKILDAKNKPRTSFFYSNVSLLGPTLALAAIWGAQIEISSSPVDTYTDCSFYSNAAGSRSPRAINTFYKI